MATTRVSDSTMTMDGHRIWKHVDGSLSSCEHEWGNYEASVKMRNSAAAEFIQKLAALYSVASTMTLRSFTTSVNNAYHVFFFGAK